MKESEYTYLSAFMHITKAINSSLNLNEVLHLIVKNTCEATGSKGCTLMLLNDRGERLEVRSSYGLSDHYIEKGPLLADKSISDTLKGNPIIIEDITADPRLQYPREAKQEGIASIISVPIILRETVIGAFRLYTSVPCRFSEDDIDFLSAIGMQCGIAIDNARMYEHVRSNYEKVMTSYSPTNE